MSLAQSSPPRHLFFHEEANKADFAAWWKETTSIVDEVLKLEQDYKKTRSFDLFWTGEEECKYPVPGNATCNETVNIGASTAVKTVVDGVLGIRSAVV